MFDIVTFTMNPAIDMAIRVDRVVSGKKLRGGKARYDPGGGGINVARVLHRLGHPALAVFPSGGPTGALLRDLMGREGIDCRLLPIREWVRQNVVVSESGDDRQFRFGVEGPELSSEEWKAGLEVLKSLPSPPRFVVASGSLPPGVPDDYYARLARETRRLSGRFILDTHGPPLSGGLHEDVFLVKLNHRELGELTSGRFRDESQIREGGRRVLETYGCEHVLISLGSGGAILMGGGPARRYHAPPVSINSRIGAGDSMVAGIIAGLMRGMELGEAVALGVAAGSAAVLTPGTELCEKEDVERLYTSMKQSEER